MNRTVSLTRSPRHLVAIAWPFATSAASSEFTVSFAAASRTCSSNTEPLRFSTLPLMNYLLLLKHLLEPRQALSCLHIPAHCNYEMAQHRLDFTFPYVIGY